MSSARTAADKAYNAAIAAGETHEEAWAAAGAAFERAFRQRQRNRAEQHEKQRRRVADAV